MAAFFTLFLGVLVLGTFMAYFAFIILKRNRATRTSESRSTFDASDLDYDVAVIGGGPVGIATATLLGCYGIPCIVIERDTSICDYPRSAVQNLIVSCFNTVFIHVELEHSTVT